MQQQQHIRNQLVLTPNAINLVVKFRTGPLSVLLLWKLC